MRFKLSLMLAAALMSATRPLARSVARKISKYSLRDSGRSVTTDTLPLTRPSITKVRPVIRAASWMKARISASRTFSVYWADAGAGVRSEEHTSELQSLMRISYAVFCLTQKKSLLPEHVIPHDRNHI